MKFYVTVLSLLYSVFSHAGGGTSFLEVTSLSSYDSGVKRVFVTPKREDPDNCGSQNTVHIPAEADESMYTTILMAYATNQKVSFYVGGCITHSGHTTAIAKRVQIKP